jgi:hypothetical protein
MKRMGKNEYGFISRMSNNDLTRINAKLIKEKANPSVYGRYGSSHFVTEHEFFGRASVTKIKAEVKKRQEQGKISKRVGKSIKHSRSMFDFRF